MDSSVTDLCAIHPGSAPAVVYENERECFECHLWQIRKLTLVQCVDIVRMQSPQDALSSFRDMLARGMKRNETIEGIVIEEGKEESSNE